MTKQYGQLLKNKQAKPVSEILSWLDLPHSFADEITPDMPDPAYITGTFAFVFKGESILLMQLPDNKWGMLGGHIERHETPEEAMRRTLFEETGVNPLLLGMLGVRQITIEADEAPAHYRYPFPESSLVFYWAVLDENTTITAKGNKLFMPLKAERLDCIKGQPVFYAAALERARIVASQMEE